MVYLVISSLTFLYSIHHTHTKYTPGSFRITPSETRQGWAWALSTSWSLSLRLHAWSLAKGSTHIGSFLDKDCHSSRAGVNPPSQGILAALVFQILLSWFELMNFTVHPSSNTYRDSLRCLLDAPHPVDGSHFSCWIKATKSSRCSAHVSADDSPIPVFLNRTTGFDVVDKHHILSWSLNVSSLILLVKAMFFSWPTGPGLLMPDNSKIFFMILISPQESIYALHGSPNSQSTVSDTTARNRPIQ